MFTMSKNSSKIEPDKIFPIENRGFLIKSNFWKVSFRVRDFKTLSSFNSLPKYVIKSINY